jgi:ABC-type amino acid transport substrate-binding protein
MTELGKQLNLKIEWTDEVGTDTLFESFKSGKADANCTGYFATPGRAWGGDFTRALVYLPYNLYVRAGEKRFKQFGDFNAKGVSISTLDGELSQTLVAETFPLAEQKSMPGLTPATDRLMAVAQGKADATPMEASIGAEYMAANPGKIERFGAVPLRVGGSVIVIPHDEFRLKALLDTAIDNMLTTGAIERIVKRHEKYPGSFLLPEQPYQQAKP